MLALSGCSAESGNNADAKGAEAGLSDLALDQAPPAWQKGLPDTTRLKKVRGLRVARGIIHAHSLHSHDACDNKPKLTDGSPNEACLGDLRAGLCTTKIDFLMLAEHIDSMALQPFEKLLLLRAGDQAVLKKGAKVANSISCPAGSFRPLLMVGAELDRSMPVGLEKHVAGAASELKKIYSSEDTALDTKLKDAGAVLLQAHTESKPLTELKAHALDGVEVYNLHANLDPNIRKAQGLEPLGYLNDLAPFMAKDEKGPQPDLAFIGFFSESKSAMDKWTNLLAMRPTSGVLGTDAHQNVLPLKMRDNERMDSYRRMFRWFSNHARVQTVTFDNLKEAVKQGRGYMVFEILGTPDGFDFYAESASKTYEMGQEVKAADGPVLKMAMPSVLDQLSSVKPPTLEARLIHVDSAGTSKVVAKGSGALSHKAAAAGAYRVEVLMTPHHLRPYLGQTPETFINQKVWIYSNPIYVK